MSSLRHRKVSSEALQVVRKGVRRDVSVDVSDRGVSIADSDSAANVGVFFADVSQRALASRLAVFHLLVDSPSCSRVPLRGAIDWEAIVCHTDDSRRTSVFAAVATSVVVARCLWEEVIMVVTVRRVTETVVHRLDFDKDRVATA